jgi:hypothetical protein
MWVTFSQCDLDQSSVQSVLDHMNKQNPHIQFTLAVENNNKLPFLDVLIEKVDDHLVTSVYRKPTESGQNLQFSFNHCMSINSGIVSTLLRSSETHCANEVLRKREKNEMEKILVNNNYPTILINNVKTRRAQRVVDTGKQEKPLGTLCMYTIRGGIKRQN